jgi:hypothetical protein
MLDKGGIRLANGISDAYVALAWAEVGRGWLSLLWGVGLLSINIGNHLEAIFS